ncbi:hypothetical protein B0H12DRAFT_1095559 [Mycena haematopus]|nr:hypothetical protein B0H12DRAFT_1095559 [Mycena haematopus]
MDVDPPAESSKRRSTRTATTKKRKPETETEPSGSAPKKPRTNRSTKKGRLAGLLSISLDVVFEIFGNLHPLDVLRLSRTSKEFRELLMHKSSRPIWRSSLNSVEDMPPCPPHMNEPQWICLAFDAVCQVCQKIARKVDWHLYIRICGKCAKTCLESRFTRQSNLMDLVPTRPDTCRPYHPLYFPPELQKVKAEYDAIKDPKEQEKYVEVRKELVKSLAEHTKLCEVWSENIADNRSLELAGLKEERYTAILARLTGLGWGTELASISPMDSLRNHKLVRMPNPLTNRTWNTIEAEMIKYMEQMKTKRLAREYAALVVVRKGIALKVLRTFKRSQLPWTDVMPGAPDFYEFPKIKDIIMQPSSVTVDEQTFEALLPDFHGMFATWREGLLQQMVAAYKRGSDANAAHSDKVIVEERLKLATSVFKCNSCGDGPDPFFEDILNYGAARERCCRPLFFPGMLSHRCLTRVPDYSMVMMFLSGESARDCAWHNVLRFDARVAEMVGKVVVACGMDPETATRGAAVEGGASVAAESDASVAAESDASSPAASASTSTDKGKGKGKAVDPASELEPATALAYNWRNAVRHHGEAHWRFPTAWYMLSDADAAAARVLEAVAIEQSKKKKPLGSGLAFLSDSEAEDNADVEMEEGDASGPSNQNADPPTDTTTTTPAAPHPIPLPSQLPEIAFSCAHCIDAPREPAPMTLQGMAQHLRLRHELLTPAVLNEDYFRALAAPEIYDAGRFPAPRLEGVMIPLKPDLLPEAAGEKARAFWGGYMGMEVDEDDFESSEDEFGYGGYEDDEFGGYW